MPGLSPRSCPPPLNIGESLILFGLVLVYKAPAPFGPYILCAVRESKSIFISSTLIRILPIHSLLNIQNNLTNSLCCVCVKEHVMFSADFSNFFQRLDHSNFIIHCHDCNQKCIRPKTGLNKKEKCR